MKYIKLILIVVLIQTSNVFSVHAQADEEGLFSSILNFNTWIEKLNSEYKKLMTSESKDECLRKLGYVGSDLKYIIKLKQDLLLLASRADKDPARLQALVGKLSHPTRQLTDNIRDMDVLINDELGAYGNENLNKLSYDLLNEKAEIHAMMEKDIESKDFKKFKTDTEYAISLLRKGEDLIWALREKLLKQEE